MIDLASEDVFTTIQSDPAFAAIVDTASYAPTVPGWTYATLSEHVVRAMRGGHAVAWGAPEDSVRVRITTRRLAARALAHADATAIAVLDVTGPLCLADYTSLTMAADDGELPRDRDAVFAIRRGRYRVAIHRMFAHADGEQFAGSQPLAEHYVIVLASEAGPLAEVARIPWAVRPES